MIIDRQSPLEVKVRLRGVCEMPRIKCAECSHLGNGVSPPVMQAIIESLQQQSVTRRLVAAE
jgi:hypothetical protein